MKDFVYAPQAEWVKRFSKREKQVIASLDWGGKKYLGLDITGEGFWVYIIPEKYNLINFPDRVVDLTKIMATELCYEAAHVDSMKRVGDRNIVKLESKSYIQYIDGKILKNFGDNVKFKICAKRHALIYLNEHLVGFICSVRVSQREEW